MRRILHLADLHLGYEHRYLGERSGARSEEALQILERLVDWAIDDVHYIAAVLIAGDLFETHEPDPLLIGRVITTLKKIPASGRTLITVPGNHDEYSYPESVYRLNAAAWPGVLVTTPTLERVAGFDLGGFDCEIYSMAYTAGLSPRSLQASCCADEGGTPSDKASKDRTSSDKVVGSARGPGGEGPDPGEDARVMAGPQGSTKGSDREIRIALLHGTLDADPTDRSYRIDSRFLVESRFSYAALGHIHKPAETRIGDGLAVYPGTLNGKGFDDPGAEELVVVSFPDGRPLIERVPFPTRAIRTRRVDLARYENQEDFIAGIEQEAHANTILRLELFGPRPSDFDPAYVEGRLRDLFFYLEMNDQSMEISADEIDRLAQQPTIRGFFVQRMREKIAEAGGNPVRLASMRTALYKGLAAFESTQRGR